MSPWLIGSLLVTLVLTCATWLQPRALSWTGGRQSDHLMQVLLGDGRKILANHMFVQADVYFHSGYYPSVFDQQHAPKDSSHMTEEESEDGHVHTADCDHDHDQEHADSPKSDHEAEHEKAMAFLREPKDWIEAFGRHFMITEHKHLEGGAEREMLPFLKLSAELDPHRIETYTVAAYWLGRTLGKPDQAEDFLRTGLRANPRSYEILFELGQLYYDEKKDPLRAGNLWEAAYARWNEQEAGKEDPNLFALDQIMVRLAKLAEDRGDYDRAIGWLQLVLDKQASPNPANIKGQIQKLRSKASATK